MGQTPSSSASSSASFLAIHAVAEGCCQRWSKVEMRGLIRRMKALGARSGKPTLINRRDLEAAVKETGLSATTEAEILVVDKVSFALELYETGRLIQREEEGEEEEGGEGPLEDTRRRRNKREEEEGKEEGALFSRADVRTMLGSMNMMAAFLGDEPLPEEELDALLSSVFPPSSSPPPCLSSSSPKSTGNPFEKEEEEEEEEEGGREGVKEEEEEGEEVCVYKTADEILTGVKKHPFVRGSAGSAVGNNITAPCE